MEEDAELGTSQTTMAFPVYRRSHLRSNTYYTLVHLFSHLSAFTASRQTPIEPLSVPDNGSGRMEQENQEMEPKCSEHVSSDCVDPKDPVPQKEIQEVHESIEGDKDTDFSSDTKVSDDIELMLGMEETSTQANGFDMEQLLMDEFELIMKGTEDLVWDIGLIPLNLGFDEKQNSGSEVGLMDFQLDDVEFLLSNVNLSGNANPLQEPGELNPHASEGFDLSSMFVVSTSTEGQTSALEKNTCSSKHESQQKEMELVESVCTEVGSLPTTEEGEFEKEEQRGQKFAEAMHFSVDMDMNSRAFNMSEDCGLPDSTILKDNHEVSDGEKLEKIICGNNAANSSNILMEKGDMEEGEISGDMNGYSFDMHSADALMLQQWKVDQFQKPGNAAGNMVYPSGTVNGESEKGCESDSFMANSLPDVNNSRHVEPRTGDEKRVACSVEAAISRNNAEGDKAGECGSLLRPGTSELRHTEFKGINELLTNLTQNQILHGGFMEETATNDHGNSSAVKLVDATGKRKHGPGSEEEEDKEKLVDASKKKKHGPVSKERKEKKKIQNRKNRTKKNREQGVNRFKLQPVQKPKPVSHCHHYLMGRCHEGDKCQFLHDVVPLTKSKKLQPCVHFARHSCMKGDDCPFDHQLLNYPCTNFVSIGSCSIGDTCMFSHKVQTNVDIPTPSNVAELKSPLMSGNANCNTPLKNLGSSSVQQNHHTNYAGIHSHINAKYKVTDTIQKQPIPPKGISFINVAQLSPSPSALTTAKERPVQIGPSADRTTSGASQNKVEIPNKLPVVTPKGIKFLSFGKDSVCSFKSPIRTQVNKENGIKFPQLPIFGLPEQAGSSLNKDDYRKVSHRTKQNVPQTDLFSNESSEKNQSGAEGMKLKFFPWTTSMDVSVRDPGCSKSVQEGKKPSDNSQTSNVNSATFVHPFVPNQPFERLISGCDKHASKSGQRAPLSTLAFAAEHESHIKMKNPTGASGYDERTLKE